MWLLFSSTDAFLADQLDYIWDGEASKAIVVLNEAMNEFDLSGVNTHKEIYSYVTGEKKRDVIIYWFL